MHAAVAGHESRVTDFERKVLAAFPTSAPPERDAFALAPPISFARFYLPDGPRIGVLEGLAGEALHIDLNVENGFPGLARAINEAIIRRAYWDGAHEATVMVLRAPFRDWL